MGRDNATGADNQQERPGVEQWVVGFVDGEGCFLDLGGAQRDDVLGLAGPARVLRHASRILERRAGAPRELHFQCGAIIENRRSDNHREPLLRFSVKRRSDLVDVVVPYFEANPLRTAKQLDFEKFTGVLRIMEAGGHLTEEGLRRIASITETMNRRQRSRYLESSEAIRQPTHSTDELKIWSEPHGDMRGNSSEIPCRVSSDLHEWRNDFPTVSTTDPAKLKYE